MIDLDPFLQKVLSHFPELGPFSPESVRPVLTGWDFIILEVNGSWIFRFPRHSPGVMQLQKEIRLLPELSQALPMRIPQFEYVAVEHGSPCFVGYPRLPGRDLQSGDLESAAIAQDIAGFLSALHTFPVRTALSAGLPETSPAQWRQGYAAFYSGLQETVFPLLEPRLKATWHDAWREFLQQDEFFEFRPALIHADLVCEHVLVDPSGQELSGVIDWGDAAIGDPALDFAGFWSLAGRPSVERLLAAYHPSVDGAFLQRAHFYAAIIPFHEVQYALETGQDELLLRGLHRLQTSSLERLIHDPHRHP